MAGGKDGAEYVTLIAYSQLSSTNRMPYGTHIKTQNFPKDPCGISVFSGKDYTFLSCSTESKFILVL
jgi:hypothetical protein